MLAKPPYLSYNQFVLALQAHEQMMMSDKKDNQAFQIIVMHAFFNQRGRGRNCGRGSLSYSDFYLFFNQRGRSQNNQRTSNTSNSPGWKSGGQQEKDLVTCQICSKL